jgi:E3 ubiquitin-protein ligase BRE1
MQQQEAQVQQLRNTEQHLRGELQAHKKSLLEAAARQQTEELKVQDNQQNLQDAESRIKAVQKRNVELQSRCDLLTSQSESERKARHLAQKELSKAKSARSKDKGGAGAGAVAANGEAVDADMLEMSLGMLRCSVCRDRFKSVVITRCFHLFCKECIDENLRNRHRKCPACGEKFGQDDVRNIFFTH